MKENEREACTMLKEIFSQHVFEFYFDGCDARIPYMMNDAVECYLILEHCRMTGEYIPGKTRENEGVLKVESEEYCMTVRQGDRNTFTVWFRNIKKQVTCYQYHRIGHFWVKGQEQWRQLVYMIGTVYDKYQYMGEEYCNSLETKLIRLMEFAPLRTFTPIKDPIDSWYPDTKEGCRIMREEAEKAKDLILKYLVMIYEKWPSYFLERTIAGRLGGLAGRRIYRQIRTMVENASQQYPERKYGERLRTEIEESRSSLDRSVKEAGFTGSYPDYKKENIALYAAEEHPFTIMEWEEFQYRIQLMVSEYKNTAVCAREDRNGGFFTGGRRSGYIIDSIEGEWKEKLKEWE